MNGSKGKRQGTGDSVHTPFHYMINSFEPIIIYALFIRYLESPAYDEEDGMCKFWLGSKVFLQGNI